MGKLVVTEFITLDGVIQAPGGGEGFEYDGWSFKFDRGDDGNAFKFEELTAADAQLLGRVTYEGRHTTLKLAKSQQVGPDGVVILTYVPAR